MADLVGQFGAFADVGPGEFLEALELVGAVHAGRLVGGGQAAGRRRLVAAARLALREQDADELARLGDVAGPPREEQHRLALRQEKKTKKNSK